MRRVLDSHAGLESLLRATFDFLDHEAVGQTQHQARYSAIVLAMYAGLEGQVRQTARLCGEHIARGGILSFDQLPLDQRILHVKDSVLIAEGVMGREPSLADVDGLRDEHPSLRPFGPNWWRVSALFLFGRNIWPEALHEKVRALGGKSDLAVSRSESVDQPFTSDPLETLRWLVRERNQIAHGNTPDNLLDPTSLRQLSGDLLDIARAFARELSIAAAGLGSLDSLARVGTIDRMFGSSTVGLPVIEASITVGQEALVVLQDGSKRIRRVRSIQRHGESLESAAIGDSEVAVSFDRGVQGAAAIRHLA
jgi:hypothetical protein